MTVPSPSASSSDSPRLTVPSVSPPRVSIVIPVYNEEAILQSSVVDLIDRLRDKPWSYEIILTENGSTDGTVAIAQDLSGRFNQVRYLSMGEANYGKALKDGILSAAGDIIICDEIDLCDIGFHEQAIAILDTQKVDMVIGSKLLDGASDERPLIRHMGSVVINGMLRLALGFRGTDTHGLKAFRKAALLPVVRECIVDKDLFASELVIRAQRSGIAMLEVPVRVLEKRPPSIHLFRRVPNVIRNLSRLVIAIRIKR
ncbi:MAG: glycosyltransferase [Myxococcales bacterium]|nr:glycosyltransferase [Myxococcales bacterium]MCB9709210.1 glycosyltransferase [Myxococcales bacterium]